MRRCGTKANNWIALEGTVSSHFHVKHILGDKIGRKKKIMAVSQILYQRKSRDYQLDATISSTPDT